MITTWRFTQAEVLAVKTSIRKDQVVISCFSNGKRNNNHTWKDQEYNTEEEVHSKLRNMLIENKVIYCES